MANGIPLILDVDTGVDDALALGLAHTRPDIDLLAVATLAGNIDVNNATENTLRVLDFIGAGDVPVYQGASRPIARAHRDAAHYHGLNGLGNAEFPAAQSGIGQYRGPAAIIRLATEHPGELVLVAVGPLTNVAIALNVFPQLPSLLKRFVIMGGAYDVPGNVTPFAEFNIWADPEAAAQVFATDFPEAIAVGLDVSHQTMLTRDDWKQAGTITNPLDQMLVKVCQRSFVDRDQTDFPLHDPLATAVAVDSTLVGLEKGTVEVVLSGDEEGRTVFTRNPTATWNVATSVDSQRFVGQFKEAYHLT